MVETVTVTEAARLLGVSRSKVWNLVREGTLEARQNPLDKRERLISMDALRKLKPTAGIEEFDAEPPRRRPRFVASISVPELQSDEIEGELMEENDLSPLTEDERRDVLAVIQELKRNLAEQAKARGGTRFPPSWETIREDRRQRSERLLNGSRE